MNIEKTISVFILTFNEELHIRRAIESALSLTSNVYIVDSNSSDNTLNIAAEYNNLIILQYSWDHKSNWVDKVNYAISSNPYNTPWVVRLDADEYFNGNFKKEIINVLYDLDETICGVEVYRKLFFLGKLMKHSNSTYPEIRIYRPSVKYISRLLDEKVDLPNELVKHSRIEINDNPLTGLSSFIKKHDMYSYKEAFMCIHFEIGLFDSIPKSKSLYYKLPLFCRPLLLFIKNYFFYLGILDGYKGFLWCFFQTFWYRMLVDAKINYIYEQCGKNKEILLNYFYSHKNI